MEQRQENGAHEVCDTTLRELAARYLEGQARMTAFQNIGNGHQSIAVVQICERIKELFLGVKIRHDEAAEAYAQLGCDTDNLWRRNTGTLQVRSH